MAKKINNQTMNITTPSLFETKEFRPTRLCVKAVYVWCMQAEEFVREKLKAGAEGLVSTEIMSLPQIVKALGHNRTNYYHWARNPAFRPWLRKVVEELISNEFLPQIQLNLARKASRTHDSSMVKLALERFDTKYKPTTAQELRHQLPCHMPKETTAELAERSRRRERSTLARLEAERKQVGSTVVEPMPSSEAVESGKKLDEAMRATNGD